MEIIKKHGFKVDGKKVSFSEDKVLKALETVPSEFTIQARNPKKSITIGGDHFALGPGWGAPLIIDASGKRRNASMEDQDNFCKLVQTSPYLDLVAGSISIKPTPFGRRYARSAGTVNCIKKNKCNFRPQPTAAHLAARWPTPAPGGTGEIGEIVEMAAISWGGVSAKGGFGIKFSNSVPFSFFSDGCIIIIAITIFLSGHS